MELDRRIRIVAKTGAFLASSALAISGMQTAFNNQEEYTTTQRSLMNSHSALGEVRNAYDELSDEQRTPIIKEMEVDVVNTINEIESEPDFIDANRRSRIEEKNDNDLITLSLIPAGAALIAVYYLNKEF